VPGRLHCTPGSQNMSLAFTVHLPGTKLACTSLFMEMQSYSRLLLEIL